MHHQKQLLGSAVLCKDRGGAHLSPSLVYKLTLH